MRDIAAAYDTDLAFLSPGFKPNEVKVLAMDMDSTLINIECIDEIADFTGVSADYEVPLNPDLILDTTKAILGEQVEAILQLL